MHGCTTEGIHVKTLPFFQLMNSLVILKDEKPTLFPPPFKARMSFSYEIRAVATNFEGLGPLRKKRQNKSFVQRTLGGLSRHLSVGVTFPKRI